MDLKTSNHHPHPHPQPQGVEARKEDPFDDRFPDNNLCNLTSLKETSNLVKLFPMARKDGAVTKSNVVEAPPTPGRPVFSFSVGSRKNFPSKWDDAEKWLISGPDSPAHHHLHGFVKSPDFVSKQSSNNAGSNGLIMKQGNHHKTEVSSEEKVSKAIYGFQVPTTVSMEQDHHHHNSARPFNGVSASDSSDVLLKDKFTNGSEANVSRFKCLVPINQGFLFSHLQENSMKDASTEVVHEVKHRETGTNMTPDGSSTTSRCPTPFNCLSPPRHNTPANMSGPLTLLNPSSSFDIADLQECHLAKLQLETPFDSVTCNWSSREEEEEDISKSLRHFEMSNECPKSIPEPRACAWDEEGKTKSHLRYQREEAKIQAWVNLQNAKAEAQSRKLEVKIQKMRSKFEEKMMRRMASVHRKAEELRAAAQREHNVEIQKINMGTEKMMNVHESMHFSGYGRSCGCFPCSNLHP
ncbi:uncharacterized protein LOC112510128 [Cynara cardunculus var. scolymus]|uniref:uncharacterized protein LOC112510128 n=1 Tax=Cynara cardunculus var. scolymus TaxID=59895 RepID=UPI000D62F04F|nr:uncharacterized protein LOC112510128 [Cynara cardunculus var. scolymus]